MPTISVTLTEEEEKRLLALGHLSTSVREAVRLYLDSKRTEALLERLEDLEGTFPAMSTGIDAGGPAREDTDR